MTSTTEAPALARPRPGLLDPATYRNSLHLAADLIIGTVTFTIMVTLLALSAGLMITLAGIPLLLATLLVARSIGIVERKRAHAGLVHRHTAPASQPLARVRDRLRDRADWRAVLYAILLFPVGIVTGTLTLAGWATAVGLLTSPLYTGRLGSVPYLTGINLDGPVAAAASVLAGLALLLMMPAVVRTLARVDTALVHRLLT